MFSSVDEGTRNRSLSVRNYGELVAYDPGALDASLAAAIGDDSGLQNELRGVFIASVRTRIAAMRSATTEDDWRAAAIRLRSLAASFGALRLLDQAQAATKLAYGDSRALAQLDRTLAEMIDVGTR